MTQDCTHSFDATTGAARSGIAEVMARLRACGLPEGTAGDVELALTEVVNNVVEHGYAGGDGRVRVEGRIGSEGLELRVSDTGRPLPGERIPPAGRIDPEATRANLPEGGFGWALIHQLADAVRYERRGTWNTVSLRFTSSANLRSEPRISRAAP